MLGVGDFYYELAVQVIEVCIQTRPVNGGLINLEALLATLRRKRGKDAQAIVTSDVEKAVSKIKVLGSGFKILTIGGAQVVQSVPLELSPDHATLLAALEARF